MDSCSHCQNRDSSMRGCSFDLTPAQQLRAWSKHCWQEATWEVHDSNKDGVIVYRCDEHCGQGLYHENIRHILPRLK